MKVCYECKAPKEINEFNRQKRSVDGYRGICKACRHTIEYLPVAKKKIAAHKLRYKTDAKFCRYVKNKANHQYAKDKTRGKERSRRSSLKRFYGFTPEQYERLFAEQGGVCAICKRKPHALDSRRKRLCIDHNHACCSGVKTCGKCVRGLICGVCNSTIGFVNDSIECLQSAIDYLKKYN